MSQQFKRGLLLLVAIGACSGGSASDARHPGGQVSDLDRMLDAAKKHATSVAAPDSPEFARAYLEALNAMVSSVQSETDFYALRQGKDPHDWIRGHTVALDARFHASLDTISSESKLFIWGGRKPLPNQYREVVAILGNNGVCTGTFISPSSILTARHCICKGVKKKVVFGNRIDQAVLEVPVVRTDLYSQCASDYAQGDLALVHISQPVRVSPRPLAPVGWLEDPASVRAIGFGRTSNYPMEPIGTKRLVDLPVASPSCSGTGARSDADVYGCTPGLELVAGAPWLDKDTCVGDSGGPLLLRDIDGNGSLGAVTSRPIKDRRKCGDGGVYVRIDDDVRSWLTSLGVDFTIGGVN